MTRTVAIALAEGLRRHGIEQIFGQSLPSLLILEAERRGIRQVAYRTENAGGAMADAAARISRRIGVVTAQNGPAATLLVPPLAEAFKASIPVLALVQEVTADRQDRNAFQELDHHRLFDGVTKWCRRLPSAERAEDFLDMAITQATTGRPGPVVLLLPKDILAAEAGEPARSAQLGGFPLDRVGPDPRRVDEAAALLASAERPVVIAGGGVHLSGAASALGRLQEELSLAVGTTNMGKGAVDETHPLSLGVIGNAMSADAPNHRLRHLVHGADVAVLVGTRTNENGTDAWTLFSKDTTFIHLDIDGTEVGRNYEALRLVGDARLGLEALTAAVGEEQRRRRRDRRPAVEAEISASRTQGRAAAAAVRSVGAAIDPRHVMSALDDLLPAESIVVADASFSTLWVTGFLRARVGGQRFLTPRGLAGLGWGLPMALGAKVARPGHAVVCVTGDGGFGHVWSELETAVRERINVTVIVLNNSILGFQKHSELEQFGEHTSAIRFAPVDHTGIAAAVGMRHWRVGEAAQLADALDAALRTEAPTLVEVLVDEEARPPITAWQLTE